MHGEATTNAGGRTDRPECTSSAVERLTEPSTARVLSLQHFSEGADDVGRSRSGLVRCGDITSRRLRRRINFDSTLRPARSAEPRRLARGTRRQANACRSRLAVQQVPIAGLRRDAIPVAVRRAQLHAEHLIMVRRRYNPAAATIKRLPNKALLKREDSLGRADSEGLAEMIRRIADGAEHYSYAGSRADENSCRCCASTRQTSRAPCR